MREVIDAHFHLWDVPFPQRPFPYTPDPFPLDAMVELMERSGVSRAAHVTPVMYGFDNSYGLEAFARSQGRIVVFGRFDPLARDPENRLRSLVRRQGIRGVRLTFYGEELRKLDDPAALEPFWAAAERLGVWVSVFAPDALWDIVRVVERHPRLKLIVDHLGLGVYPGCRDPRRHHAAVAEFAAFEQVLVKVSGVVEVSREAFPFADVHELLAEALERFGAGRLMWGSNYPVVLETCDYAASLTYLEASGVFSGDELDEVLAGTCARMLDETPVAA